jgi:hypothetical protein
MRVGELIVAALVTGAISAVGSSLTTVIALRADFRWMKRALKKLEGRVDEHDKELRQLQLDIGN